MSNKWLLKRFVAAAIDIVIQVALPLIIFLLSENYLFPVYQRVHGTPGEIVFLVCSAAPLMFWAIGYRFFKDGFPFTGRRGCSIGKRLMGLRVVSAQDVNRPCGWLESMGRNLLLTVPLLWPVETIAMSIDPQGRSIGDRIAGTRVIDDVPGSATGILLFMLLVAIGAFAALRVRPKRTVANDQSVAAERLTDQSIAASLNTDMGRELSRNFDVMYRNYQNRSRTEFKAPREELIAAFTKDQSPYFGSDIGARAALWQAAPTIALAYQDLGDRKKAAYYYAVAAKIQSEISPMDPRLDEWLGIAQNLDPNNALVKALINWKNQK